MYKKYWNSDLPEYDEQFDRVSDNLWSYWKNLVFENPSLFKTNTTFPYKNAEVFYKTFGFKPILNKNRQFDGLEFKNKAQYMLFLMEWS